MVHIIWTWTTCLPFISHFGRSTVIVKSANQIEAHKLCIAMHYQWVASYPSIASFLEGSPNAVTSSQSVIDIVSTHCAKKNIQVVRLILIHFFMLIQIPFGSKIAIQVVRLILIHFFMLIQIPFGSKIALRDNKMVHHHGYVHLSTHTDGSLHVTSNRTNSDGSAITHGLTPTSTSSYTLKGKLDLYCCIAGQAKPMS